MDTPLGFDTLKSFVHLGFAMEALLVDMSTAKGLDIWLDAKKAMDLLPEAKSDVSNYQAAVAAFESMTDQQKADLYAYCMAQMNLPAGKVQADVTKALETAFKVYEIYMIWRPATPAADAPAAAPAPATEPTA